MLPLDNKELSKSKCGGNCLNTVPQLALPRPDEPKVDLRTVLSKRSFCKNAVQYNSLLWLLNTRNVASFVKCKMELGFRLR